MRVRVILLGRRPCCWEGGGEKYDVVDNLWREERRLWKRGLFLFLACVEVSRCHHDNSRAASTTALCYSHGE